MAGWFSRFGRPVKEMIGRGGLWIGNFWASMPTAGWIDTTVSDYQFNDKMRRGQAKGYEFSGPLTGAIAQIVASWVMGDGVQAELVEGNDDENSPETYTNGLIKRFMRRIRGLMLNVVIDLYGLADQYIFVNPDSSLSVVSPDAVTPVYDELDGRKLVKVTVKTRTQKATVTDEYRLDGRTVTLEWHDNRAKEVQEFQNLIGRLPVVHFANDRSVNETNGRTIWEPLRYVLSRYNDLLKKALKGAELMSNPIPTFEGMESADETIEINSETPEETYTSDQGVEKSRPRILWDKLTAIWVTKGGSFNFKSPARGFTEDVKRLLKLLFTIAGEVIRIPDAVWGFELGQARASAGEQMKTFYQYIMGRRLAIEGEGADALLMIEAQGGFLELLDIWLRIRALIDRKVKVAPVQLNWPDLSEADSELNWKWTTYLHKSGIIKDETAVDQAEIVTDPDKEVEEAKAQREAERDQFERAVDDDLNEPDPADEEEKAA